MNDALKIFGIAALVAVAFTVAWLVAVLRDGRRLRGMGHWEPPPPEHPNCRCQLYAVGPAEADDDSTQVYPLGDVPGVEP